MTWFFIVFLVRACLLLKCLNGHRSLRVLNGIATQFQRLKRSTYLLFAKRSYRTSRLLMKASLLRQSSTWRAEENKFLITWLSSFFHSRTICVFFWEINVDKKDKLNLVKTFIRDHTDSISYMNSRMLLGSVFILHTISALLNNLVVVLQNYDSVNAERSPL